MKTMLTENKAKDVVLSFIKAINDEDFSESGTYLSENMTFTGPLGTRNGAKEYMADMERMKFKYKIKRIFHKEFDVCILCDVNISGVVVLCCNWYHVAEDKIDSLQVIFDPRPVLEAKNKN